jgi:hypothetical protein
MLSSFPEDARWNAYRQAVEFGVEIGEYRGVEYRAVYSNAYCRRGPPLSVASRRTTSNGPGSRASLSGSCACGN